MKLEQDSILKEVSGPERRPRLFSPSVPFYPQLVVIRVINFIIIGGKTDSPINYPFR
jgi:hypothetical protein